MGKDRERKWEKKRKDRDRNIWTIEISGPLGPVS
jgi:hypothetical protein